MLPISLLAGIISNQGTQSGGGGAGTMPTPPSSGFVTFTLTSPSTGTYPFSIGHTFKQGDLPSGSTLTGLQCTIKNTWPDGSAKIAVLSGGTSLTANTPKTIGCQIGSAPTGSNLTPTDLAALITQSIVFSTDSFGSATFTSTDILSPFLTWVSGPLMSSFIYRKQVGSDAHLVAWMEVRFFLSGEVEVLPWVENGYTMVAGPTSKAGTYTFTFGGTQRFSGAIELRHHMRSPLLNGTKLAHWLLSDRDLIVLHDRAYLMATELVPTYRGTLSAGNANVTFQPTSFTPLQQGGFRFAWTATNPNTGFDGDDMSTGGYGMPIGLLPTHDILSLTSHASDAALAYKTAIWNGYSAGRYHTHYRDEGTNYPLALARYPTMVFAESSGLKDAGSSSTSTRTPTISGGSYVLWDTAHCPSVGYMAYLLTGKRYFMEEAQFALLTNHYNITDESRAGGVWNGNGFTLATPGYTGASGICTTNVQIRSSAWHLRSLMQAFTITPADDALFTDIKNVVEANINWFHVVYVTGNSNPFGLVHDPLDYNTQGTYIPGVQAGSAWMQDFVTGVWGYALALNPSISGAALTKLNAFYTWKAQNIVNKLGDAANFWYVNGAPYASANSPSPTPNYFSVMGTTGPWYASWKAMYDATYGPNPSWLSSTEGVLASEYYPENPPPSMWHNLQPAIAYAVRHGIAGALTSYNRMVNASNWSLLEAGFSVNPVWGVMPASGVTSSATAFTLSCVTSGITGTPVTVTVTPNGPVPSTIVVTLAATNSGTLGTTTLSFASGSSTAQSTTLTRNSDGSSSLSITNNGGLANSGTPIMFTTTSASGLPTWLSSTPINQAVAISGTSSGIPAASVIAWGCFVLIDGTATLVSAANGGHSDSADNGVYALDLSQNTPAWVTKVAASSSVQPMVEYYADGKPVSRHGYQHGHYISQRGRVMLFGARGWYSDGGDAPTAPTYGLDVSGGTWSWDSAGTWASLGVLGRGYGVARDPRTGNVWTSAGWLWNQAANSWSQPGTYTGSVRWGWQWDYLRNRFAVFQWGDGQGYATGFIAQVMNGTTGAATNITWATDGETVASLAEIATNNPGVGNIPSYESSCYDIANDCFWLYYGHTTSSTGAQTFYKITPQNSTTGWTMTRTTFGGSAMPLTHFAGINGRIRYIPSLGGFMLMPSSASGVYFVRTSQPVTSPAWLSGTPVGVWKELSGTDISSYTTTVGGQVGVGIMNDYSGVVLKDDDSRIIAYGGGHAGYSGNEVLSLSLETNSPTWQTLCEPTPLGSRVSGDVWWGTAPNQKPNVPHTYDSGVWSTALNSILWISMRSPWNFSGTPSGGGIVLRYKWDTQSWAQPGSPDDLGSSQGSTAVCKDTSGNIYSTGVQQIYKYTPGTGWTTLANDNLLNWSTFGALVYDSARNKLFRIGDYSAAKYLTINCSNGAVVDVASSLTGAAQDLIDLNALVGVDTVGACYDPDNDRYVILTGVGGEFFAINAGTFAVTRVNPGTTAGTLPNKAGGSVSGIFGRVKYVPRLKVIVYFPSGGSNAWVLRTI